MSTESASGGGRKKLRAAPDWSRACSSGALSSHKARKLPRARSPQLDVGVARPHRLSLALPPRSLLLCDTRCRSVMPASTSTAPGALGERQPLLSGQPAASTSRDDRAVKRASAASGAPLGRSVTRGPATDDYSTDSGSQDGDSDDDSAPPPPPDPTTRRRTLIRWLLIWTVVAAVTTFLIVQAFRRGGGEFDWKGALKKAGGGVRPIPFALTTSRASADTCPLARRVSPVRWLWSSRSSPSCRSARP